MPYPRADLYPGARTWPGIPPSVWEHCYHIVLHERPATTLELDAEPPTALALAERYALVLVDLSEECL